MSTVIPTVSVKNKQAKINPNIEIKKWISFRNPVSSESAAAAIVLLGHGKQREGNYAIEWNTQLDWGLKQTIRKIFVSRFPPDVQGSLGRIGNGKKNL